MRVIAACLLTLALAGPARAAAGPALSVDAAADRHAISPDVYGINGAGAQLADELALPVDRWGGNLFERYNFTLGAVNTADDYFFENIADCFYFDTGCGSGNTPYYRGFVERDVKRGTKPLMQLPMAGFIAKDAPTAHPFTCGFPKSAGGSDDFDPFDANCGNGRTAASDPARTSTAITDADRASWVKDLAGRGVHLYELGNEPNLWNSTHRDIHPAATTYDELWAKSRTLSTAIKDNDPAGQVVGFSEWGWPNYFCSAADHPDSGCYDGNPQNTDRKAHGGVPLVNWLLQRFREESSTQGRRLLDYIDVHYYPAGRDSANRMDVTRSLWDPAYKDPSYVDTAIRLIPRMREWVAADYPGTKTALTEYDLLDETLSGRQNAVIQADALGIFGREGLDLATFFDEGHGGPADGAAPTPASPIADAFRVFRNYDGKHGTFGDTSVRAASADPSKLAVYAAIRADSALTVLVVNKTAETQTASLSLAGADGTKAAQVYRWTGEDITRLPDAPPAGSADYPMQSLSLYVLPDAVKAPAATTPGPTASPTPGPTSTPPPTTTTVRKRCAVPKVRTLTRKRATRRLRRSKCHFKVRVKHARGRRGRVLRVRPKAGTRRPAGSRVTITVGRRRR